MRPKIRQIAPLIAVSALVLCLYPLRAKKEQEEARAAQQLVRPTDGDAVSPEAMPMPEEIANADDGPGEADDVLPEPAMDQEAQRRASAEYLNGIRRIPGAAPLLDDIIASFRDEGDDALSELPVDDDGVIALDDPMTEKLLKNPEVKAKWDQLMALIAQNPPPKHQLRN